MIRKIRRLLTVLLILALFSISFIVYGIYVSVERLNINYETITSSKIPTDLNNLSIAFISDIHYNGFMNQKRLEPMIQKINEANPDIIIFGGDLFDHTLENTPSSEVQLSLIHI